MITLKDSYLDAVRQSGGKILMGKSVDASPIPIRNRFGETIGFGVEPFRISKQEISKMANLDKVQEIEDSNDCFNSIFTGCFDNEYETSNQLDISKSVDPDDLNSCLDTLVPISPRCPR